MMSNEPVPRVRLERPSKRREDDFLEAVRRSRKLHRHLVTPPSTMEKYREFLNNGRSPRNENFLVVDKASNDLAGVINVEHIIRGAFKSAFLGYFAFTPFAGRGLIREGLGLVLDHAFGTLKLHRLEANIQPHNERSKALIASLGFRLEGYSKYYLKISGRWRDHERWAMLAEEWQ